MAWDGTHLHLHGSHEAPGWPPCLSASIKPKPPSSSSRHILRDLCSIATTWVKSYPDWLVYFVFHTFLKRGLVLEGFIYSLKNKMCIGKSAADDIEWRKNSWQQTTNDQRVHSLCGKPVWSSASELGIKTASQGWQKLDSSTWLDKRKLLQIISQGTKYGSI